MRNSKLIAIGAIVVGAFGAPLPAAPAVGDPAPEFSLESLLQAPEGATPSWESLRGKVVVLEFWATWCGPCVAAIPHLNEVAEKMKDKNVQFISITDESPDVVNKFLARKPIKSWIGLDTDRSMHDAYAVKGIPRTFIIGPDGRLAADTLAHAVTEEVLAAVLADKKLDLPQLSQLPPGSVIMAGVDPGGAEETPLYQITIRQTDREGGGTAWSRGRMTADAVNLSSVIAIAYDVRRTRVICPEQLDKQRYTVVVNMPRERDERGREQLQSALNVAFGVRVSPQTREMECYVLGVPEGGEPTLSPAVSTGGGTRTNKGYFSGTGQTADDLARYLESVLTVPVVNETKLDGRYDVMLKYDGNDESSLIDAVRETLGLSMTSATRPIDLLVVEPE